MCYRSTKLFFLFRYEQQYHYVHRKYIISVTDNQSSLADALCVVGSESSVGGMCWSLYWIHIFKQHFTVQNLFTGIVIYTTPPATWRYLCRGLVPAAQPVSWLPEEAALDGFPLVSAPPWPQPASGSFPPPSSWVTAAHRPNSRPRSRLRACWDRLRVWLDSLSYQLY